ncbi:MAG: family transporter protein [Symbiobacteriaceae bacterium]|jgi:ABC-type multidrug transport system permease subunit|nr:family transporter protein [Symbiobacteriaceae bacterium]
MVGEYMAAEVTRLVSNAMAADMVVDAYRERQLAIQWQDVWDRADGHWQQGVLLPVEHRESPGPAPAAAAGRGANVAAVYGLLASLVLYNGLLTASWMIEDRNSGVLRRLVTTSTRPERYLLGSSLAMGLVAVVTVAGTLLAFRYGLGWDVVGGGRELLLAGAYVVAVTGLAVLAGALVRTEFQLQVSAPWVTVITGVLGAGGTLSGLSDRLAIIGLATPQGWLLQGLAQSGDGLALLHTAVLSGAGLAAVLLGVLVAARRQAA